MSDFRRLTDSFSAAPQLAKPDFEAAKAQGFSMIINNRPDNEEPGQFNDAQSREAAQAAGLGYESIPMVPGELTPDMVTRMGAALDSANGPVLAYCRTGTRSTMMWALSQAQRGKMSADEIMEAARTGGYDISHLKPQIEAMSGS